MSKFETERLKIKDYRKVLYKNYSTINIMKSSIFQIKPSQDLQAPRYIQVCPLPTNSPKDSFCSDLQQDEIVPMTQKH